MILDRTAPSIRGAIPLFLLFLALSPMACRPPLSSPGGGPAEKPGTAPAVPATAPTPAEIVWRSRPRAWDRVLVGLTHLPDRPSLTARPLGPGRLFEVPSGRLLARIPASAPLMLEVVPGPKVRFVTRGAAGAATVLRLVTGSGDLRLEGKRHTGSLLCWPAGQRVACALDASIEDYLCGVLPGEVPAAWPMEAQKALAVAARTYVQASRGKHAAEGFDLCDGTDCQMYLGHVPGAARSERAVRETRGLVALYDGKPIHAFYSADCGGRTANNEDVPFPDNPPEPLPYLRSVPDVPYPGGPHYCARSPHQHWTRLLSAEQVETALNIDPNTAVGALHDLRVTAVDPSGRAKTVQVAGSLGLATEARSHGDVGKGDALVSPASAETRSPASPGGMEGGETGHSEAQPVTRSMAGYAFRRAIGPRRLKSTRFTITPVSPTLFRVTGSGYGHGVGLCQIGARGMALPPYRCSFRQILAHYYRGITITRFHPTGSPP